MIANRYEGEQQYAYYGALFVYLFHTGPFVSSIGFNREHELLVDNTEIKATGTIAELKAFKDKLYGKTE